MGNSQVQVLLARDEELDAGSGPQTTSMKDLKVILISNQRVKLLPYSYTPIHVPGKANVVPDT